MALTRNLSTRTFGSLQRAHCHHLAKNISCIRHSNPMDKAEDIQYRNQYANREGIDDKTRISANTERTHFLPGNNEPIVYQRHFAGLPLCSFVRKYSSDSGNNSDSEEVKIYLEAVAQPSKPVQVDIVAGKGPPPEPPIDCCMSGCANCVWIQYAEELKTYFTANEGLAKAKEAIETIENPGLQMFLKLELGLL